MGKVVLSFDSALSRPAMQEQRGGLESPPPVFTPSLSEVKKEKN